MMSDDPMTGFEYKGVVIDNPPKNHGNNNHHSLVEYQGNWYVFYHSRNLAISRGNRSEYQRSVNIDRISFAANGDIIQAKFTDGDIEQLKNVRALGRIEAELMAAQSGVEVIDIHDAGKKTGVALTDLHDGNWSAVSRVDFGQGATTFTASIASEKESGKIEVWIDGGERNGGTLLGVCDIPNTGGLENWREVSYDIKPVAGVHNLYLIYKGPLGIQSLFLFDYYRFE
jgi:arabinoxylan arabinofuranohydrolase